MKSTCKFVMICGTMYKKVPVKVAFGKCAKCAFCGSSDYSHNGCDVNDQIGCAGIIFQEVK